MGRARWHKDWRPLDHDPAAVTQARHSACLSQRRLAIELGVSRGYVCEIEQGHRNANPALLLRIAEATGCPVRYLMAKPAA